MRATARVVASPKPLDIVEKREIRKLIGMGFIVICCGGGGIPVMREGRAFHGIDAVIDKDLASARLAAEVGVDTFLMAHRCRRGRAGLWRPRGAIPQGHDP